jgi:predicted phosphate transport protein (TIGR00153 family)
MVLDNGRFMSSELSNITQMLDEHFRKAVSANKIVVNAISEWLEGKKSIEKDELQKITELEEKGDKLKRTILNELAEASTLMQREDLLKLVFYNDKGIDGSEIACYHLAAVVGEWTPEGELKEKIAKLGELIDSQTSAQREAVRFLSINMENSMKQADEICRLEKEIDVVQREIVTLLYPLEIPLGVLLRFRDFINMLEDMANFSEDAALVIRTLSLTLNT